MRPVKMVWLCALVVLVLAGGCGTSPQYVTVPENSEPVAASDKDKASLSYPIRLTDLPKFVAGQPVPRAAASDDEPLKMSARTAYGR